MFPMDKALTEMIEQAMETAAPQMHARLKASGLLANEIQDRAREAKASYLEAIGQEPKASVLARQKMAPMDQIAERTMQQNAAAQIALAQATEFPRESEPASTI